MLPLTGPAAPIGEVLRRGVELAVDDINEAGGAGGMQLRPLFEDNKGTAEGGAAAANKLVNLEKVPYIVSSISSSTLATMPIAARSQVVVVNNGGSDPALLDQPFLYNNQIMNDELIPPMIEELRRAGFTKAALMTVEDPYGQSGREIYKSEWRDAGGEIVADEVYQATSTDLSAQLRNIKAADPDVILVMATGSPFGTIAKQARAAGIDAQIAGPLGSAGLIATGGEAAEGVLDISRAVDPAATGPEASAYISLYRETYGEDPNWESCVTAESVYILADLIAQVEDSGGDPRSGAELDEAMAKADSFPNRCVDGEITFLDNKSIVTPIALRRIEGGAFVNQKIFRVEDGEFVTD
jgi:branched-chain amino acid transport system substrate-binding protein